MNINNFPDYIDKTILSRGMEYYQHKYIKSLEYDEDDNEWIAEVSGNDYYTVTVKLSDSGDIIKSSCDCPYDYGMYCKHQAAVFYAVRSQLANGAANPTKNDNSQKKESLKDILNKADKQELADFLIKYTAKDRNFKSELMLNFTDKKSDILTYAKNLINLSVKKASHGGFVEYDDTEDAVEGAEKVLQMAEEKGAENLFISASLCVIVLEEMIKLSHNCEDGVSVHGIVSEAISCLQNIYYSVFENNPDFEKTFYLIFRHVSDNSLYNINGEWREDILFIFVPFCHINYIRDNMEKYLTVWQAEKPSDKYTRERIQSIQ